MAGMILCPTRGGKASYPNQERAIALAKERGVDLLFLYVSNVEFLGQSWMPKVVDIEAELDEMGDFLLAMAQERAQKAGVTAHTTVRRGVFNHVLREVIAAYPIDSVVMGSAAMGAGLVTPEYMRKLGEEISREMKIEFIVLHAGEIVCTFPETRDHAVE
jgi:nucleotide-binding universal stress UspA family protein